MLKQKAKTDLLEIDNKERVEQLKTKVKELTGKLKEFESSSFV